MRKASAADTIGGKRSHSTLWKQAPGMELLSPRPEVLCTSVHLLAKPSTLVSQDQPLPGGSVRCRAHCYHQSPLLLPCSDSGGVLAQQGGGPARVPVATSPQAIKSASQEGVVKNTDRVKPHSPLHHSLSVPAGIQC